MKRRFFLLIAAGVAGAGLFAAFRRGRPTAEELARAKPLAIDPEGEEFVYIDGWITDIRP